MSAAQRRRAGPRTPAPPNPAGAHALADQTARRLVRYVGVTDRDLVLDLGAGLGALTRPLAGTGARVIAVERDPRIAGRLARALQDFPQVTVVTADMLAVPLPHRPFRVVANIPFGTTTALLRRLVASRLSSAELVVQWGAGRLLAAADPGRPELLRWRRRFDFSLGPVLPANCFRPPPRVDAVVLRRRRRQPGSASIMT